MQRHVSRARCAGESLSGVQPKVRRHAHGSNHRSTTLKQGKRDVGAGRQIGLEPQGGEKGRRVAEIKRRRSKRGKKRSQVQQKKFRLKRQYVGVIRKLQAGRG